MLDKTTVERICMRHLPMLNYGTCQTAKYLSRASFERSILHWTSFAKVQQVSAKQLIRLIKTQAAL